MKDPGAFTHEAPPIWKPHVNNMEAYAHSVFMHNLGRWTSEPKRKPVPAKCPMRRGRVHWARKQQEEK